MMAQLIVFFGQFEKRSKQEELTYQATLRAYQASCLLQEAYCLKSVREFDENPQGNQESHLPGST